MKKDLTGKTFGTLTVIEDAGTVVFESGPKRLVLVKCECGTQKVVRATFLTVGQTTTCGDRQAHRVNRKASTHYNRNHDMVRAVRGSARGHDCVDCGEAANQWSHVHGTETTNPDSYEPRCTSCHIRYDHKTPALV